jgi:hypothetical protein
MVSYVCLLTSRFTGAEVERSTMSSPVSRLCGRADASVVLDWNR